MMKITGADKLERALRELGTEVAGRLGTNAVRAGARVIARDAKRRAPVGETGDLKKSVKVPKQVDRTANSRVAYAGSKLFYSRFVEFGTSRAPAKPFLRPAMDEQAQAAVQKMLDNLGAGINKVIVKNGGVADNLGVTVEPEFGSDVDE